MLLLRAENILETKVNLRNFKKLEEL